MTRNKAIVSRTGITGTSVPSLHRVVPRSTCVTYRTDIITTTRTCSHMTVYCLDIEDIRELGHSILVLLKYHIPVFEEYEEETCMLFLCFAMNYKSTFWCFWHTPYPINLTKQQGLVQWENDRSRCWVLGSIPLRSVLACAPQLVYQNLVYVLSFLWHDVWSYVI